MKAIIIIIGSTATIFGEKLATSDLEEETSSESF